MKGERRSHKMSEENWATIDAIAADLNVTAKSGSRVGLPSWRSLLYQIATGKLVVVRPGVLGYVAKILNHMPVAPAYQGRKRHILAVLRNPNADR